MDPNEIILSTTSRQFTYEKLSREVENLNLEQMRDMCKCDLKLYLKQQESIMGSV